MEHTTQVLLLDAIIIYFPSYTVWNNEDKQFKLDLRLFTEINSTRNEVNTNKGSIYPSYWT